MKDFKKYILFMVLVIIAGACSEDFLDRVPLDRQTMDNFYRTELEVRAGTASLYGYPWFEFDDKFSWLAGDCMSGNIYYTYDQEGQYYYFSFTAGNSYLSSGWKGLFRVVSYANAIINDMPRIAQKFDVEQKVIDAAVGEARFIRGTVYYILTEYWGEVPIVENSTELVSNSDLMLPKNTRTSIYEFIRRDLRYAADKLPVSDPQEGRVTQWSAKGMLAKLYLTMAQNGGSGAAEYFNQAKLLSADIIENSGLSLLPNYRDLFLISNDNNEESLFALQWMKGGYSLGNSRNANWARSSIIADQQWGSGKGCTYDFQSIIESGDIRRKEIYMTLNDFYPELNTANDGYTYAFVTPDPKNPENNIESPNEVLNHLKKYVVGRAEDTNGQVGIDQDAANNSYILRLADVYLIYAEAVLGNASSTNDATALEYFNAVRERAELLPKGSITFMDILNERRVEFCLESIFWFDIKRFYYRDPSSAIAYLNGQKRHYIYERIDGSEDPNLTTSYELVTDRNIPIVVGHDKFFLPVPTEEIVVNPLLGPNEPAVEYQFSD